MRVNIWIPDKLLKELDKIVEGTKLSRSALISDLVSDYVQVKEEKKVDKTIGKPPKASIGGTKIKKPSTVKLCNHGYPINLCAKCKK